MDTTVENKPVETSQPVKENWIMLALRAVNTFLHSRAFALLYWAANLAVMAFSAQNAGYMFGLFEWSGYLVGIVLDILIIVFTQSMLAAKARGEIRRAACILLFIVICCGFSVTGNLAHNLSAHVDPKSLQDVWFNQFVPYIVSLMPLFLVALAWVADLKIDPLEKEDPEVYAKAEAKRVRFRQIQLQNREARAAMEARIVSIEKREKINRRLRAGKLPKFFRWPWEQVLQIEAIVAGVAEILAPGFSNWEMLSKFISEKLEELSNLIANFEQLKADLARSLLAQVDEKIDNSSSEIIRNLEKKIAELEAKLDGNYALNFVEIDAKFEAKYAAISEQIRTEFEEQLAAKFGANYALNSGRITHELRNNSLPNLAPNYTRTNYDLRQDTGEQEAVLNARFNTLYQNNHEPDMNRLPNLFEPDYDRDMNRSAEPDTAEREKLDADTSPERSDSQFVGEFKPGSNPVRSSNRLTPEGIAELAEVKAVFKHRTTRLKAVQEAIGSGALKPWGNGYTRSAINAWLDTKREKVTAN